MRPVHFHPSWSLPLDRRTCAAGPEGLCAALHPEQGVEGRPKATRGLRGASGPRFFPRSWAGGGGCSPQTTTLTPPCSLLVILAKYGLDGRKDSRVVSSNFVDHSPDDESLEDPRLEKLWHKVPSASRATLCPGVLPGAAGLTQQALLPGPAGL